jgi:1-acyl-sn-glycerol-3-phosphate acyltransferase
MREWNYENQQWYELPGHLKHLPLFTRQFDLTSWFFRLAWALFLKITFRFYARLTVKGDFRKLYRENPRLLIISNHASHVDAVSIAAAIPFRFWKDLYISAAKDYWFANPLFTFFSKHCLGAIPIDRKDKRGEAIRLCTTLLRRLDRIWMILFPEGTRSPDGYVKKFKRGVSLFALSTDTPILFLYIDGNTRIFPKGAWIPKPGALTIHVGPVQPPAPIEEIDMNYKRWALSINPEAYAPEDRGSSAVADYDDELSHLIEESQKYDQDQ